MHSDTTAAVRLNGRVQEHFTVQRGVKQGCAMAPILFAIALQPMLDRLQQVLTGVGISNRRVKYRAYADDIIVYMQDSADMVLFGVIIREWEQMTGMRVSPGKSGVIRPRCAWASRRGTIDILVSKGAIKHLEMNDTYDYLGHTLARTVHIGAKAEWDAVFNKMEARVERINAVKLSMMQRSLAARLLLASIAAYRCYFLPLTGAWKARYNRIIQSVMWRGARPRRALQYLALAPVDGGYGVPTLDNLAEARRVQAALIASAVGAASPLCHAARLWYARTQRTPPPLLTDMLAAPWPATPTRAPWYVDGFRSAASSELPIGRIRPQAN